MKGRKKTPLALVQLRGNPGRRPLNLAEPKPRQGKPKCPAWLTDRAKEHFAVLCRELEAMHILAACDFGRIADAAVALAKAEECQAAIREHGYWETRIDPVTGERVAKRWPWAIEEARAWEQFGRAATCLGLDPTSRARLKADVTKKADDPYQEFLEGSG